MTLLLLPGELRKKIYQECIFNARLCRCNQCHDLELNLYRIPQITGISALPLLLANKQIHHEITQLLYSNLKPINIEGYTLKTHSSGNIILLYSIPSSRPWPRHPYIQDFLRKIDVVVGLHGPVTSTNSLGSASVYEFRLPQPLSTYTPPSPKLSAYIVHANENFLLEYLRTFKSLSSIRIVIEISKKHRETPPHVDHLSHFLPLFELPGMQIVLRFELGQRFNDVPSRKTQLAWRMVWTQCLGASPS